MTTENSDISSIIGESVDLSAEQPKQEAQEEQKEPAQEGQEQAQSQEQQEQQPDTRTVPLGALHEERSRRRELQAELARFRQEQAQRDQIIEQRLAALMPKAEDQLPSFEENPAGHLLYGQQQIQKSLQEVQQQTLAQQQEHQQQVAMQRLTEAVTLHEAQFVEKNPDYIEAVTHLRNQMAAEFIADGADEGLAIQEANNRLKILAFQRAHAGQNPAEVAYRIAQARGYAKKAPSVTPEQKIEAQQKGVAAAKSLGTGGSGNQGKVSAEMLASMSDEEFAEMTKGNNWQKLMGAS